MNIPDKIIFYYLAFFSIHFTVFLLYQFEIFDVDEDIVSYWLRFTNILETAFLIYTRFVAFSNRGTIGLAIIYILNIILLVLQFIFADWGIGHKFLDLLWIAFYALLFSIDVCKVTLAEVVYFISSTESSKIITFIFENTIIGKILLSIITPVIRTVLLEAIRQNE